MSGADDAGGVDDADDADGTGVICTFWYYSYVISGKALA